MLRGRREEKEEEVITNTRESTDNGGREPRGRGARGGGIRRAEKGGNYRK